MLPNSSEIYLTLVSVTLIVLIFFSFVIMALLISQKRKYVHAREVEKMKSLYAQEVYLTQLETQRQTFERISHELHDNVGTLVSIAIVHINNSLSTYHHETLREADLLLVEALDVLRDISRSLNPNRFEKLSLHEVIQVDTDRLQKIKLFEIHLHCSGQEFWIHQDEKLIIYRIVQEALNNVVKHARASMVAINVGYTQQTVTIQIVDNGIGFKGSSEQRSSSTSGLKHMESRAALIGATLSISGTGKGVTVTLVYPNKCAT